MYLHVIIEKRNPKMLHSGSPKWPRPSLLIRLTAPSSIPEGRITWLLLWLRLPLPYPLQPLQTGVEGPQSLLVDPEHKHHDLPCAGLHIGPGTPQQLIAGRVAALPRGGGGREGCRLPHLSPQELHLHRALSLPWVLKVFLGLAWLGQLTHLDHKQDDCDETTDRSEAGGQMGTTGLS